MSHSTHLLHRLFDSLNQHDHEAMADCYHPDATFHDIAFDLRGRDQIHAMWRMICAGDIHAKYKVVHAGEREGVVELTDEYTFRETGRRVRNSIESTFQFRDGLIVEHRDSCDARAWADMALGGVQGFLAGRFRFLRSRAARRLLRRSMEDAARAS